MTTFTQGHALLIGVGADLPNTVDDAAEMHAILTDEERCAYPPGQVQLLTGEKATRADVLAGLDKLAQSATANSTVIVYFSGHGYQVDTSFGTHHFLMPFGYDQSALGKTAISGEAFAKKLQAIPAQKLLLLLDCCHAGGLDPANVPGGTLAKAPLPPEATALLALGSGRAILRGQAVQRVYAGPAGSVLRRWRIEARRAGVGDGPVRAHPGDSAPADRRKTASGL